MNRKQMNIVVGVEKTDHHSALDMKTKRKLLQRFGMLVLLLCVYPACVLVFTWSHVFKSDFKGGRNGQLDAYRHALASATVSYTIGEWGVHLVTYLFELHEKDSNRMDRHNNQIGASIGSNARSFNDIEPAVRQSVFDGKVSATDPDQVTWLSENKWRDGKFW